MWNSHTIRERMYIFVDAHFGKKAQKQEEAQQYRKKELVSWEKKSLSPNSRNNGL